MLFMLINISRVARQGVDCQRGPRKSLPAFWGALQFVAIVVNNIFLVFAGAHSTTQFLSQIDDFLVVCYRVLQAFLQLMIGVLDSWFVR